MKANLFTNNGICKCGKHIFRVLGLALGLFALSFNAQAFTAEAVDSSNAEQALAIEGNSPFSIPELFFLGQDLGKSTSAGSVKALSKIINDNIKYPEAAYKKKIQGSVMVEFSVSPYGDVNNIIVDSNANPILAQEVIRCVKLTSGMWTAADPDDTYKISIDFEL